MAKQEADIVKKTGLTREPGYIYYVDKDMNVCRAKMPKRKKVVKTEEKVEKTE
jgi:hypothetical protein